MLDWAWEKGWGEFGKEEQRALQLVRQAVEQAGRAVAFPRQKGRVGPVSELLQDSGDPRTVTVLDDVHRRLEDPDTLRALADLGGADAAAGRTTVVVAPWVDLPPELERIVYRCVTVPSYGLPELKKDLEDFIGRVNALMGRIDVLAEEGRWKVLTDLQSPTTLLRKDAEPERDTITKALAGNLCRCAGYEQIFEAVRQAARVKRNAAGEPAA